WADVYANAASFAYSEEPVDLEIDVNGDVLVAGFAPFLSTSNRDYYLIKYTPTGTRVWESPFANTTPNSDELPVDMALDLNGNAYLIGNSVGNGTGQDICAVKFNAAGQFQWQVRLDSISQTDYARSIVVDPSTNTIIVAGDLTVSTSGFLKRDWVLARYDFAGSLVEKRIFDGPASDFDLPADMYINGNGSLAVVGMYSIHGGGFLNGDRICMRINNGLNPAWIAYGNGNSFADDQLSDLFVDENGNSYVTGFSRGGENTLEDLLVVKLDSSGTVQWSYVYQGSVEKSSDKGIAIAVDANQVVYVTGSVDTSGTSSYRDIYTAALSPNGALLWDTIYAGSAGGADYPVDIAVNPLGGVYVAGVTINSATGFDATMISYDASGVQQWAVPYHGGGQAELFRCMAVDGNGNAYGAGAYVSPSGDISDGLVVKVNPAGAVIWDTTYDYSTALNDRDFFNSIALDLSGNVIVAGQSNFNFVTAQYDLNGNPVWIQNYSHSNNADSATVVKVDSSNNILVGGTFGQFIEADFGVVKYRNDGSLVWDRRYANSAGSDDILVDLLVDSVGAVYLAGWETTNFSINYNFMVVSYDSSGVFRYELLWTDPAGIGPDYGMRIGMDVDGNLYLAGDATDNCDGNTFVNGFRWDFQVNKYGYNSSVGLPDFASGELLEVFPNPSRDLIHVRSSYFENEACMIRISDLSGRAVYVRDVVGGEISIPVQDWSDGLYFITLQVGSKNLHSRFVKN
ncbi:MAG: T9SS type A sorting domain-containing protein, partial [Bacteroidota bacterium]